MILRCLWASVMIASIPISAQEAPRFTVEEARKAQRKFSDAYSGRNLPLMKHILQSGYPVDKERALSHTIFNNDRLGTALLLQEPINIDWNDGYTKQSFLHYLDTDSLGDAKKALPIAEELMLLGANPKKLGAVNFDSPADETALHRISNAARFHKLRAQQARTPEEISQHMATLKACRKIQALFKHPASYFTSEHFIPARPVTKRKQDIVSILTSREMGTTRKKARGLVALARPETIQEAIQSGDLDVLKEFVAKNPTAIQHPYNWNQHPLQHSVWCANKEARRFLIQKGMDPKTIFDSVMSSLNIPVLKELLEEYHVDPSQVTLPNYNNPQNWMEVANNARWSGNESQEEHENKKRQAVALLQAAQERHGIS